MLEGLHEVDWSRLTHAYGEAGDVPDCIRGLASDDPEDRERALGGLFGTIWHQGTIYEATAQAVPFLVELLDHPGVAGKDEILQLLSCIAEGSSYLDVHARFVIPRPGAERDQAARLAEELEWVRAAREAVEDGAATYLDLLADEDAKVRIFAAYTLGHCPGRADWLIPELVARVPDEGDPRCRAALILAAGALAAAAGAPGPARALFGERMRPGEDAVVRLSAVISEARSSPDGPSAEVIDVLCATTGPAWHDFEGLPWCRGEVAIDVGEALQEYPEARLRFLSGLLDDWDEAVRGGARYAAERLAQERRSITPGVAAALGDRIAAASFAERRGLVEVLSRLGQSASAAAGPLAVALGDADPHVRTYAALALAGLGDPRAVPALIERLGDRPTFSRAAGALGGFSAAARDAIPALVAVLRERPGESWQVQNRPIEAAQALGRIGPDARSAIPDLIALMKKQPHTQRSAAEAISRIGGPGARAAVPLLKKMLRSPEDWDRIFAARALWRIDGRAEVVLPVLIERLRPGERCRSMAAEAIGEMGEAARAAVPALLACLDAQGFGAGWVRLQAAVALWRIGRRVDRALPVLIELLRDPGSVGAPVATKAAEGLGEMGGEAREAVPVLRAAAAGDRRPFGGADEEIVTQDEAFLSAVAEALRRIEGSTA